MNKQEQFEQLLLQLSETACEALYSEIEAQMRELRGVPHHRFYCNCLVCQRIRLKDTDEGTARYELRVSRGLKEKLTRLGPERVRTYLESLFDKVFEQETQQVLTSKEPFDRRKAALEQVYPWMGRRTQDEN